MLTLNVRASDHSHQSERFASVLHWNVDAFPASRAWISGVGRTVRQRRRGNVPAIAIGPAEDDRHTGRAHTDSHDENNNNNNTPTMDERRRRTEERHSGKSPSTSAHQRIVSPRFAESFRPLAASDHQNSDTRKAPRRHERVQPTATDQHELRLHG